MSVASKIRLLWSLLYCGVRTIYTVLQIATSVVLCDFDQLKPSHSGMINTGDIRVDNLISLGSVHYSSELTRVTSPPP